MENFDDALKRAQEDLKRELDTETEDEKMTFLGTRIYRRLQHAGLKAFERLSTSGAPVYRTRKETYLGTEVVALRPEDDEVGLVGLYVTPSGHPLVARLDTTDDGHQLLVDPKHAHATVEINDPEHKTWTWTPDGLPPVGCLEVRFNVDDKSTTLTLEGEEPETIPVTDWIAKFTARRLYELSGGFR